MSDILSAVGLTVYNAPQLGRVYEATPDVDKPPIGVTLTNAVSPDIGGGNNSGGYVVVSIANEMVVVKKRSGTPAPVAGQRLYLSERQDGTPGCFTVIPAWRAFLGMMGVAATIGPQAVPLTWDYYAMYWQPDDFQNQLSTLESTYLATSNVLLAAPGLNVHVLENHTYRLRVYLPIRAPGVWANGGKVKIAGSATMARAIWSATFFRETDGSGANAPAVLHAFANSTFGSVLTFTRTVVSQGYWILDGSFIPSVTGWMWVEFAQEITNVNASVLMQGAYMEVTEQ
jgi:hypothetical protein